MAGQIRYRSGIDGRTGKVITGIPHLMQSLAKIWGTRIDTRVMRLDFGSDLRSLLSEDLTPSIALLIYNELVASAARWEPEYVLNQLQLVTISETGKLGLRHGGLYFPEGRFGNYDLAVPLALKATPLNRLGNAA
ncbi:integrase [Neorhizobium sp. T786]|uniref:GPW/gp25 family protein n=1 Tax=Pseudorhizobium xiangyangii TaxID=2883104 RepID=UPI001CFF92F4|nr:integrase [Neorhizobium xiangyangii]MCB5204255.1 integrase [Neorhizobium xiangyangii]